MDVLAHAQAALGGRRISPVSHREASVEFGEVYRRHADSVFRYCLSQLRDRCTAEDVAADVFASAFAAYPRVRLEGDGVRPWLFRMARNAVIDQQRRVRTGVRLLEMLRGARRPAPDVESMAASRQELRDLLAAMARMRPRDRQLVGLRVAGGLRYAEIAEVMHMKENAARMATQRAIARVRAATEVPR
jgi:RNA polymerase sigma-70 factor (ECF subfamily)